MWRHPASLQSTVPLGNHRWQLATTYVYAEAFEANVYAETLKEWLMKPHCLHLLLRKMRILLRSQNIESTFTLPDEKAKNKQQSLFLEGAPKPRTLFFEVAQTVVLHRTNLIVLCYTSLTTVLLVSVLLQTCGVKVLTFHVGEPRNGRDYLLATSFLVKMQRSYYKRRQHRSQARKIVLHM